jgi:hypothetical protein
MVERSPFIHAALNQAGGLEVPGSNPGAPIVITACIVGQKSQ